MHWWWVLPLQNRLTSTGGRHGWFLAAVTPFLVPPTPSLIETGWPLGFFRLSCLRHFPSWVLDELQTFPFAFVGVSELNGTRSNTASSDIAHVQVFAETSSIRSHSLKSVSSGATDHQVNLSSGHFGQVPENVITHWVKRGSATVRVHFLQSLLLIFAHVFASEMCRLI